MARPGERLDSLSLGRVPHPAYEYLKTVFPRQRTAEEWGKQTPPPVGVRPGPEVMARLERRYGPGPAKILRRAIFLKELWKQERRRRWFAIRRAEVLIDKPYRLYGRDPWRQDRLPGPYQLLLLMEPGRWYERDELHEFAREIEISKASIDRYVRCTLIYRGLAVERSSRGCGLMLRTLYAGEVVRQGYALSDLGVRVRRFVRRLSDRQEEGDAVALRWRSRARGYPKVGALDNGPGWKRKPVLWRPDGG